MTGGVRPRQGTADAPSGGFQKQHMVGTVTYMSPEVLMRRVPSFPADVYAFAILTAEVCTGTAPYADRARNVALAHTVLDVSYNDADLAKAIASEGLRPSLPGEGGAAYFGASSNRDDKLDDDPPSVWAPSAAKLRAVVERGWSADPNARPTFHRRPEGSRRDRGIVPGLGRAPGEDLAPAAGALGGGGGIRRARVARALADARSGARRRLPRALPADDEQSAGVQRGGVQHVRRARRGQDGGPARRVQRHRRRRGRAPNRRLRRPQGAECADFASRNIAAALVSTWHAHDDPGEALKEAFVAVDAAFVDAFEGGGDPAGEGKASANKRPGQKWAGESEGVSPAAPRASRWCWATRRTWRTPGTVAR